MDLKSILKDIGNSQWFLAVMIVAILAGGAVIVYYPSTLLLAFIACAMYGIYQVGKKKH